MSDSASDSDFRYQLNKNAFMPVGSEFCIDEINIPYAWNTIERDTNDKLYMSWYATDESAQIYTSITIASKRYNGVELAAELTIKMNLATPIVWSVVYNTSSNTLTFSSEAVAFFRLFSDTELGKAPSTAFPDMNPYDFKSCNDIIQIFGRTGGIGGGAGRTGVPITSGFLNLLNYQDLYLTSATLGNFEIMGVRGESSVIRKICVDSAWGFSIVDKLSHDFDWMSCSKLALSTLDFQLRDVRGKIVPLHGAHLSFTLRFQSG
jgi:hypothetical protein